MPPSFSAVAVAAHDFDVVSDKSLEIIEEFQKKVNGGQNLAAWAFARDSLIIACCRRN